MRLSLNDALCSSVLPFVFTYQKSETLPAFLLPFKSTVDILISKEIEKLENPESYALNSNHWDSHEIRL